MFSIAAQPPVPNAQLPSADWLAWEAWAEVAVPIPIPAIATAAITAAAARFLVLVNRMEFLQ
ncbi:hypothetical protein GCM10010440_73270 [Kitasatospora cinereorecta]